MTEHQSTLIGTDQNIKIYSIGYGGRTFQEFMQAMSQRDITKIIDVRSYPNTRWFGKKMLQEKLNGYYISIPELGGKNHTRDQYKDWHSKVQKKTLDKLARLSETETICLMCAEKKHQRCHRHYFVSRALKEDYGLEVQHL